MTSPFAPYKAHGVEIVEAKQGGEVLANCPWCRSRTDSSKKGSKTFCIRADGELWDCKTCGKNGNLAKFLLLAARHNHKSATISDLRRLSEDRGGISVKTLKSWGVGISSTGLYTYPAWVCSANISKPVPTDVRIYRLGKKPISTAGGKAGLITPVSNGEADISGSETVWLCEGEWDGMAWWETLRDNGITDDVFAVPGAGTLPSRTIPFFQGKNVITLYDNDTPGQAGQERVWGKLNGIAKSLRRIKWPSGLTDGYDIRDLWMEKNRDGVAVHAFVKKNLIATPFPGSQAISSSGITAPSEDPDRDAIDQNAKPVPYRTAQKRYANWLHIEHPALFDIMFGSAFANRMNVDPLWMFIVGPSGGGKSEALMSLASAPLIHCSTSLTNHALISGMGHKNSPDPSLLPKLLGKTWVIKDFTGVLSMPQIARDDIFSILRDAYDGKIEKAFGNGLVRNYEGRFGIIAGVTGSIDSSTANNVVLGERFIRWRLRFQGKVHAGKEIAMRTLANIGVENNMREELRAIGRDVMNRPIPSPENYPKLPKWFCDDVYELASWVAMMRRVVQRERWTGSSGVMACKPSQEISTRLVKQFAVLAMGIAVYRNVKEIDREIYRIIVQVGRDTCPDRAEEIIRAMYILGGNGTVKKVAEETHFTQETTKWVLDDLTLIGVVSKRKTSDGVYEIVPSIMRILKKLRIYDDDKAWRWVDKREEED